MSRFDLIGKIFNAKDDEDEDGFDTRKPANSGGDSYGGNDDSYFGKPSGYSGGGGAASSGSSAVGAGGRVFNVQATTTLHMQLYKPTNFSEVNRIADAFKAKTTIVLNLEQTEATESGRILDFLAGVAFALDGKVKRTGAKGYVIIPFNVDFTGDLMGAIEGAAMSDIF